MNILNLLGLVHSLFQFESVFVKVLLQFLVRKIDTELFERVGLENLKTENIQHTNKVLGTLKKEFRKKENEKKEREKGK